MSRSRSHSGKKPRLMNKFNGLEDFIVIDNLGRGGYSTVDLVEHKKSRRRYALKCAYKFKKGKDKTKRTYMEIRVLQKLKHPNIIKLYDWFEDDETIYLVLEYIPGKDLSKFFTGRTPDKSTIIYIIKQLIEALLYIHKKRIIHRDIKLGNILIDDELNIKLTDFGLCAVKKDEYDMFTSHLGTARFTSPEMISGEEYNESCDVWSVGIVLFKLLTGVHPFNGSSRESIFRRITEKTIRWYKYDLDRLEVNLLKKLLRKDPDDRIELEHILSHPFLNKH